jgi:hypothetical protein
MRLAARGGGFKISTQRREGAKKERQSRRGAEAQSTKESNGLEQPIRAAQLKLIKA